MVKSQEKFRCRKEIYALTFPKKCVYFNLDLCARKSKAKMPIQDITLGQFAPRNSFVHRLDPRTKLAFSFLFMTILFFIRSSFFLTLFFLGMCILYRFSKLQPALALRNLRPFLWLFVLTVFLHAFFSEGVPFWTIRGTPVALSKDGLFRGVFFSLRIADLMVLAGWYTLTTSPMSFADSLEKLLTPFRKIGVPAHEIAMMMSISLRFIPILLEEIQRIQNAQMSRGVRFSGNPVEKIRNAVPVLIPLFVSSFHRANDLALAMDSRCYRGGENRTAYMILRMRTGDGWFLGVSVVFGLTMLLTERLCF